MNFNVSNVIFFPSYTRLAQLKRSDNSERNFINDIALLSIYFVWGGEGYFRILFGRKTTAAVAIVAGHSDFSTDYRPRCIIGKKKVNIRHR